MATRSCHSIPSSTGRRISIAAVAVIFLGLWLIASGFTESAPAPTAPAQVIAVPPQTASLVILGTALLAGGVVFFILPACEAQLRYQVRSQAELGNEGEQIRRRRICLLFPPGRG